MSAHPRVSLIAAVAANGVIGDGKGMPWRLSSDMRRFKALTLGKPVIMGRKTWETIGKPLVGRLNIVMSRQGNVAAEGVTVVHTLDEALARAAETGADEIMILGGGEVYRAAIDRADRLYITHVEASPEGDTRFPAIDPALRDAGPEERLPAGEKDTAATRFVIYERKAPRVVR